MILCHGKIKLESWVTEFIRRRRRNIIKFKNINIKLRKMYGETFGCKTLPMVLKSKLSPYNDAVLTNRCGSTRGGGIFFKKGTNSKNHSSQNFFRIMTNTPRGDDIIFVHSANTVPKY